MVNSLVATSNIVLYAPELDSGLRHAIESLCPEANIRCTNFALDDWLKHVGNGGDVDGVILDTDAMGLGDLKTVGATLKLQPQTWCLLLVGDRGIAVSKAFSSAVMHRCCPSHGLHRDCKLA